MSRRWSAVLRKIGVGPVWAVVWLSALAVPFLEARPVLLMAALGWLSALALAKASFHGRRLVRLAFFFLLFWSLLMLLSHLLWPSTLRPVLNLAAWLALGLNLMLAKTPLELALAAGRGLRPLAGRLRAQKLALALALLARLIPAFLDSALKIRITVGRRAAGLPPTRRLSLWAAALVRAALSQTDELSRALIKRWPWD